MQPLEGNTYTLAHRHSPRRSSAMAVIRSQIKMYAHVCFAGDVLIQISDSQRRLTNELEGVVCYRSSSIDPSFDIFHFVDLMLVRLPVQPIPCLTSVSD